MTHDDLVSKLTGPRHVKKTLRVDRIIETLREHNPPLAEAFVQVITSDMPARTIENRMREIARETGLDISVSDTSITTWRLKNGHTQ